MKRAGLQEGEDKGRHFVGEGWVSLAAQGGHLRPVHGGDEAELGIDHAGMRLIAAQLRRHRPVQLDDVLNRKVADAVNR